MKKVRKLVLILVACWASLAGFSQGGLYIVLEDTSAVPTVVVMDSSFTFSVVLRNVDTAAFSGSITFGYEILHSDSTAYGGFSSDSSTGFEYAPLFVNLPGFGTQTVSITAHITLPAFKAGPSVVVIWPIASGAINHNDLTFTLNVLSPAFIDGKQQVNLLRQSGNLYIERRGDIELRQVRIFDIQGRLLLDMPDPVGSVPLPDLQHGLYMVEVIYGNDRRKVFRFFN
jgi:hypothetical protein